MPDCRRDKDKGMVHYLLALEIQIVNRLHQHCTTYDVYHSPALILKRFGLADTTRLKLRGFDMYLRFHG